jgi:hypothetical protein
MRKEILAAFEGKAIEVIIRKKKKHRSTQQNRYYWGVVVELIKNYLQEVDPQVIWTPEKVHELLKFKFLRCQKVNPDTAEIEFEYTRSTTDLSTSEFMDLIAQIQQWSAETFDLYIPDPNEGYFL